MVIKNGFFFFFFFFFLKKDNISLPKQGRENYTNIQAQFKTQTHVTQDCLVQTKLLSRNFCNISSNLISNKSSAVSRERERTADGQNKMEHT